MSESGKRKRLSDILISAGLIQPEQLEIAIKTQKRTSEKLTDALVSLGYVTNEEVINLLESELGIPHVHPDAATVEADAIKLVSEDLARRYELIPIRIDNNNSLIVAMSDPLNIYAVEDLTITTGHEIVPVIASGEEIRKAISVYYGNQKAMEGRRGIPKGIWLGFK